MQRNERFPVVPMMVAAVALVTAGAVGAQALWKYTDKNGKVTYSDKAPKKGETAQLVTNDPSANVIETQKSVREGVPQKTQEGKTRDTERENLREKLKEKLAAAKAELELARKALEDGREPQADEVQIVVGRSPTGAPTGANAVIRKPAYYARITSLEEAVKKAEANVEVAEREFQRAP